MRQQLIIPEGYNAVMPYLIIPNATKFIEFMYGVFDATERYKAMRDENTIMHAEIAINGSIIMLADSTDDYSARPAGMFIYVADADKTFRKAIALGASILTPVSDQPYGRSGGVKDPFGNTWWITTQN